MYFKATITKWEGLGKGSRVKDTVNGTAYLLNANRAGGLTTRATTKALFNYFDNPYDPREVASYIECEESVSDIQTAIDLAFNSLFLSLPAYIDNDPTKETYDIYVNSESIILGDSYNPSPTDTTWITYQEGQAQKTILVNYSIDAIIEGSSGWTAQYTDTEIQVLIDDGYIPIASPADLNNIRTVYSGASTKIFAKGTKWETAAINTLGLDGKYVQTCDINLDWTDSAILVNYNAANAYIIGAVVKQNSRIYYCWANAAISYAPTGAATDNNSWLHINTSATFTNGWAILGTGDTTGMYDGGFYWLDSFYQIRSAIYSGLFRSLNGATALIQNVLMSNIRLTSTGSSYTSPICSFVTTGGTIRRCYTNGIIKGVGDTSGIAFAQAGGIVDMCCSDCNIAGLTNATVLGRYNDASSSIYNSISRGVAVSSVDTSSQITMSTTNTVANYNIGIGFPVIPSTRVNLDCGLYNTAKTNIISYWDGENARRALSSGGTGVIKSTSNGLKQLTLPTGWDGSIWNFGGGKYPFLKTFTNLIPNIDKPIDFEAVEITPNHIRFEWKAPTAGTMSYYRLYKAYMVKDVSQTLVVLAENESISQVGDTYYFEDDFVGDQRALGWYGYYVRGVFEYKGRMFETIPSPPIVFEEVTLANQFSEGLFALSFDDGHKYWDTILTPLLVSLGKTASLFMTKAFLDIGGGDFLNWIGAKYCYDQGMDVQCHFSDHVDMAALFTASGETAISAGLEAVNDNFVAAGIPIPKHIAYPLGPINAGGAAVVKRYRQTGRSVINYNYDGLTPNINKWEGFDISGAMDRVHLPAPLVGWDEIFYRLRRAKYSRQGISLYSHQVVNNDEDYTSVNRILASYVRAIIEFSQLIGLKVVNHTEFYSYLVNTFPFSVVIPSDAFTFGDTTPATNDFVIIVENGKAFTIGWGDTTTTSHTGTGVEQRIAHEYATAGTYTVTISYHGNELKHFQVEQTSLNLSFNLNIVPHGIETLIVNAANTMLGDMKTLAKTTLSKLVIGGANVISGDFNKIPYYVTHCDIQGANTMSTYAGTSAAKFPMDGLNTLISIPVTTGLNEASIDLLINDLADVTWAGANKVLTLTGAHAIPSAASAASITALQAQGVTVTVNS